MRPDFRVGDVIRLRKQHPCGGFDWAVVRIGADIGLKCTTCNRRVLLARSLVEGRLRAFVSQADRAGSLATEDALEGLELPPGKI